VCGCLDGGGPRVGWGSSPGTAGVPAEDLGGGTHREGCSLGWWAVVGARVGRGGRCGQGFGGGGEGGGGDEWRVGWGGCLGWRVGWGGVVRSGVTGGEDGPHAPPRKTLGGQQRRGMCGHERAARWNVRAIRAMRADEGATVRCCRTTGGDRSGEGGVR